MDTLKQVVVFANPSGDNQHTLSFLSLFNKEDSVQFQLISLAEQLPDYAKFPSADRKKRLEDVLSSAAKEMVRNISQSLSDKGVACGEPEVLSGRFPASVETWLERHTVDLLVKQALPSDGEFGCVSKGDVRLSRHTAIPLLLLSTAFTSGSPVVVGIPPLFDDRRGLSTAVRLINHGVYWARKLDAPLHLVHAWELIGESYLKARETAEELKSELGAAKADAHEQLMIAVEEANIPEHVAHSVHLHKGDPTRILLAEIDLVQPALVILGSAANDGVRGAILGNTAETVARRTLANTLIVK